MIATVFLFRNGMLAVCDEAGQQLPAYQGYATPERVTRLLRDADPDTEWNAWPSPPCRSIAEFEAACQQVPLRDERLRAEG